MGVKNKKDVNAAAEGAETQLVQIRNTATTDGKVDLAKVQDIVRALRRRYQSRSNVQTIFKDWDKSGKGFLEPNDIQTMLDKMGLKVNRDEAEMLVLCIDTDGNERVTMNEFLDLVFTQNDGISSLDLNRMGVGNEYLGSGEERKQSFVEELKKKAELAAKLRPMNQWKFFIQKNLNNIAMDLLAVDSDRKYYVEYKDLMKVIDRRAKIPEYLKQESGDLLHEFMGQYVDHNNGHVDYRSLVEDIREFNYEQANQKGTAGGDLQETHIAAFSKTPGNETRKRKTIFEDNYIVLDSQKVPPNMLDQID
jgi:Ca2+-binding EF-hand superfamily protein